MVVSNLVAMTRVAKDLGYTGPTLDQIDPEKAPKKKRDLLKDPQATLGEIAEEIENINKENVSLKEENSKLKGQMHAEKQKLRDEKQKLVYKKAEFEKKLVGEQESKNVEALRKKLEENYLPKIKSLNEKLEASNKKFENLEGKKCEKNLIFRKF